MTSIEVLVDRLPATLQALWQSVVRSDEGVYEALKQGDWEALPDRIDARHQAIVAFFNQFPLTEDTARLRRDILLRLHELNEAFLEKGRQRIRSVLDEAQSHRASVSAVQAYQSV